MRFESRKLIDKKMKPVSSFITGLLAGAAIGGVIALLYSPKSGKENREMLKQNLKGKAAEKSGQIRKDLADRLAELQREIESLSRSV
jgi:gas vesicle protein